MKILQRILGVPKPDPRDTNQLIFDLVEHGNRQSDLKELYRRLPGMEFFAKVLSSNFPLQSGARITIGSGQVLQIQNATLPGGFCMAQFFIDSTDPRLQPQFLSISPREAFEMVLKMDSLTGLLICNSQNSWIALLKPEIRRLLKSELAE